MVAPLIVGTTRVIAGKKTAQRINAAVKRPQLLRKIKARERRKRREENPLTDEQKQNLFNKNKKNVRRMRTYQKISPVGLTNTKRIKAGVASSFIFWTAIWYNVPQLFFGIISLIGFGIEEVPFASYFLPGEEVFMAAWLIVAAIGVITMFYALLMYLLRGVNCFSGFKGFVFVLCISFYFIPLPLLNAIPWFVGWLWIVTYAQGKDDDSSHESKDQDIQNNSSNEEEE